MRRYWKNIQSSHFILVFSFDSMFLTTIAVLYRRCHIGLLVLQLHRMLHHSILTVSHCIKLVLKVRQLPQTPKHFNNTLEYTVIWLLGFHSKTQYGRCPRRIVQPVASVTTTLSRAWKLLRKSCDPHIWPGTASSMKTHALTETSD